MSSAISFPNRGVRYESYRRVINSNKFLRVEGVLQNQDHVISVKASRVMPISITAVETESHDFH